MIRESWVQVPARSQFFSVNVLAILNFKSCVFGGQYPIRLVMLGNRVRYDITQMIII